MKKVVLFTSDSTRHHRLIYLLREVFDEVVAVIEYPETTAPIQGGAADLSRYFGKLRAAESIIFGDVTQRLDSVDYLRIPYGSLDMHRNIILKRIASSDVVIVFGASFIRGPLCDALIDRNTVNLHAGISPYYRGSACNFWAQWDKRYDLVGVTVHALSAGLDSGDIFFHVLPEAAYYNCFEFGFAAIMIAQHALIDALKISLPTGWARTKNNNSSEIRYSRISDFEAYQARTFLAENPTPKTIKQSLAIRDLELFVRPIVLNCISASSME